MNDFKILANLRLLEEEIAVRHGMVMCPYGNYYYSEDMCTCMGCQTGQETEQDQGNLPSQEEDTAIFICEIHGEIPDVDYDGYCWKCGMPEE